MHTHVQKNSTVQKIADSKAASLFDSSSQSESLQRKADLVNNAVQRAEPPRPNNTGMPDNLKSGIESLSGFSMDDVRVHYNSSKPATVQALAYTQGTDIHVAPGQEKHLPHEAWHVAQQMSGRVSPTTNINGMPVNDNAALEHEADVMGEKAETQRKEKMCIKSDKSLNIYSVQRMPKLSELSGYGIFNPSRAPSPFPPTPDGTLINNSIIERTTPVCGTTSSDNSSIKKVKALQEIAAEAGRLGELSLKPDDHFYAIIPAIYTTRRNNNVTLKLKYDFRASGVSRTGTAIDEPGGPGYIVAVSKTKKGSLTDCRHAEMVAGKTTENNKYSNEHEKFPESKQSILADTYRKGPDDKYRYGEDDFKGSIPDAYTKLAGEGARFCCVRDHLDAIKDSTIFRHDGESISFTNLYGQWSSGFGNRFNISDDEICIWLKQKPFTDGSTGNVFDLNHTNMDRLISAFSLNNLVQEIKKMFPDLQENGELSAYHFFSEGRTVSVEDFANIINLCKLLDPKQKINFDILADNPLSFISTQMQSNWSIVSLSLPSAKNIPKNFKIDKNDNSDEKNRKRTEKKEYNKKLGEAQKDGRHTWHYNNIDYIILN